ncbi:uncharacterized protein LOC111940266 [Cyanistes caeruleus]|uniref:uncharacterized protein LOC111940266 n=1 Tax=Cyanistes caeruleus TaxID=156563 RepID=UPI000CDA8C61|nr:uncharacterized protein LOC111940266 [Cyanistes caeruleus]
MGEVALAESGVDLPTKPGWPYILPFLSSTCALSGVKGAKDFMAAKMCSQLSGPSQSSDRGCHRMGPWLRSQCCPGMGECGLALLEIRALPALCLAAAVVISIAMAMPAWLPRRVRLCLRQADAVPRRAGAPLPPQLTQLNSHATDRGLAQPQNAVGMEMGMSPPPGGDIWVGSRGRRRVCTWNISQPCPAVSSQVPSTTAGPLCPTATLGSAIAPLCWYQPLAPKVVLISTWLHQY